MQLDDRSGLDQYLDPERPDYCSGCGQPKPAHTPTCEVEAQVARLDLPLYTEGEA